MLMMKIWNYFRGYVIILVEGRFVEKFINICTRRQILLWEIELAGDSSVSMKVSIRGFERIRPVARKSGCRVRILEKCGLPFIFHRYRKRKTFVTGMVVFFVLLNVFASFVWDIEITGIEDIKNKEIQEILNNMGIRPGSIKYGIDPENISRTLMLEMDELSWCGVEVKGTRLKIRVNERNKPPEIVPVEEPCNIVASTDGMIESLVVKSGREMVKPGDTVIKGQILVTGIIESSREKSEVMMVHSIATVKARTWYEGSEEAGPAVVERRSTGKKQHLRYLELFGRKVGLPFSRLKFSKYELVVLKKKLSIGSNFVLPFGMVTEVYSEYEEIQRRIDEEEAKRLASDIAYRKILDEIPKTAQIVDTDVAFEKKDNGRIKANVIIECIEDIGMKRRIGGR